MKEKKRKEKRNMGCPYLERGVITGYCNASVTLMTPSIEETGEYCETEEHYRCPMLLPHVLRGGRGNGMASSSLN